MTRLGSCLFIASVLFFKGLHEPRTSVSLPFEKVIFSRRHNFLRLIIFKNLCEVKRWKKKVKFQILCFTEDCQRTNPLKKAKILNLHILCLTKAKSGNHAYAKKLRKAGARHYGSI
ncbi:hypothetical protein DHD08_01260 [Arenibacter sp. H213]|nr:hypothetical protein [Arenibacter sp. H213]